MSATDIEERVAEYVNAKLYENDFDAEIIDLVIFGSRCILSLRKILFFRIYIYKKKYLLSRLKTL